MSIFEVIAVLLCLAALFSYVNARFIGMPTSIAVMALSLGCSLILVALEHLGIVGLESWAQAMTGKADFGKTLLDGMLSFLLFSGALHVKLDELFDQRWLVALLATVSVVISTFIVGGAMYYLLGWLGISLPLIYCLLFGAVVAPTDPVAVLAILNSIRAPASLSTKIAGESLFNDGVAVVLFLAILGIAQGSEEASFASIGKLFLEEAVGGIVFGLVLGWVGYLLLKRIDNYQVEVLITLALVAGGYALASRLHMSGPLAVVVAGLMIGNQGRKYAMSEATESNLDTFWELIDEVLNAVLFLLIGLEVLLVSFSGSILLAGLLAIPLVLAARLVSVGIPVLMLKPFGSVSAYLIRALTWGGLRGGVSVALALSMPEGPERDLLVPLTYIIVVFSILIQGLTVKRVMLKS